MFCKYLVVCTTEDSLKSNIEEFYDRDAAYDYYFNCIDEGEFDVAIYQRSRHAYVTI